MLKIIGTVGQAIDDNVIELAFTKSATRLLIVKNVLQFDNLARQGGNFLLCLVNQRQSLAQITQRFCGFFAAFCQIIGHVFAHLTQLLGHGAGQFALCALLVFGQRAKSTRKLVLLIAHGIYQSQHLRLVIANAALAAQHKSKA